MFHWIQSLFGKKPSHAVFHAGEKSATFDDDWTPDQIVVRVEFWNLVNTWIQSPLNKPFLQLHHYAVFTHTHKKKLTAEELGHVFEAIEHAKKFVEYEMPFRLANRRAHLTQVRHTIEEHGPDEEFEAIRRLLIITPQLVKRYLHEINENSGSAFKW